MPRNQAQHPPCHTCFVTTCNTLIMIRVLPSSLESTPNHTVVTHKTKASCSKQSAGRAHHDWTLYLCKMAVCPACISCSCIQPSCGAPPYKPGQHIVSTSRVPCNPANATPTAAVLLAPACTDGLFPASFSASPCPPALARLLQTCCISTACLLQHSRQLQH